MLHAFIVQHVVSSTVVVSTIKSVKVSYVEHQEDNGDLGGVLHEGPKESLGGEVTDEVLLVSDTAEEELWNGL